MTAADTLRKALVYLDHGKSAVAEHNLIKAIQDAEHESDEITRAGAMCCLGELYYLNSRFDQSRMLLEEVARLKRDDDVLDYEMHRAAELLQAIPAD